MLQLLVVLLFSLFRDNVSLSKRNMGFASWTMPLKGKEYQLLFGRNI